MAGISGKVVSISLDVVSRETGRRVKTASAQLKISRSDGAAMLHLLAACEEGMFEAQLSPTKLKRAKTKKDLSNEEWEILSSFMFDANLVADTSAPDGFENVIFAGRLTSSEEYDPDTGELIGEELSETPPEFELFVRTGDRLPVEYGAMFLQHVDMDEVAHTDREKMDLLTWISEQSAQNLEVRAELSKTRRRLEEIEAVLVQKERTIEEMESDYKTILRDMEDRFFQVLQSKKRKIAELEGDKVEDFGTLNQSYKERQKSNLKILHLEDIIVGEEHKKYGERSPKRDRKTRPMKRAPPPVGEHEHVTSNSGPGPDVFDVKERGSLQAKPSENAIENSGDTPALSQLISEDCESSPGAGPAPDLTDYSGSDDNAGPGAAHVTPLCGADNSDEGNETEYSD